MDSLPEEPEPLDAPELPDRPSHHRLWQRRVAQGFGRFRELSRARGIDVHRQTPTEAYDLLFGEEAETINYAIESRENTSA